MEEKKLTDEDIIKAFEICYFGITSCDDCPYEMNNIDCTKRRSEKNILDLIHRLRDENKRLIEELQEEKVWFSELLQSKNELQEQVDELKEWCDTTYKKAIDREEDAYSLGFDKGKEQAEKDTAKEILQEWAEVDKWTGGFNLSIIYDIAKRKGVEVE